MVFQLKFDILDRDTDSNVVTACQTKESAPKELLKVMNGIKRRKFICQPNTY